MATACLCGLPAFISVLMFAEIVLADFPRFRGILILQQAQSAAQLIVLILVEKATADSKAAKGCV